RGAGSMSALAATTVHRAAAGAITVANRTRERADRLAGAVEGTAVPLARLADALAEADLVISCTGAVGHVVDLETARAAAVRHGGPQLYVDLALPRDVDPAVAGLPGVEIADLQVLGSDLADAELGDDIEAVRQLVAAEVGAYLTALRVQAVAPTVVALRTRAAEVVAAELQRLDGRLPEVDAAVRDEVQRTVHRVVEKLLHAPTVRVKELAGRSDGGSYAAALRELFDLDPQDVATVTDVPVETGPEGTAGTVDVLDPVDPGSLVARGDELSRVRR
ncbi:glutamyl-tRNA reductase, partial [Angustibacter aerolatus]